MRPVVLVAALLCVLAGCGGLLEPKEAKFEITKTEKDMWLETYPLIRITVKNTGNATGYRVGCQVRAKDSEGLILDTDYVVFAGAGNIDPGESAQEDAIFRELSSHDDYSTVDYDLDWYTRH